MTIDKNKKGQEEMVGFVIIVIMLIVMGMFFLFMVKPKQVQREDLQADNLLNAILESTIEGTRIRDMIEDCASGITDSCETARPEIRAMLNASLAKSGLVLNRTLNGYNFTSSGIYVNGGVSRGSYITAIAPLQNTDVTLRFYYGA